MPVSTSTPPAGRRSAAGLAYDRLKREILSGSLSPGADLGEITLAQRLGVSRTPVREALQRLQSEGLVQVYPKKGAVVVPVSAREATALWDAREMVELWALPRAVPARERIHDRLAELVDAAAARRDAGDVLAFTEADRDFHEVLVQAADNAKVSQFYRSLRERQMMMNVASLSLSHDRLDHAVDDHRRLLALLDAGDLGALETAMREHLAWSRDIALAAWSEAR